MIIKRFTSSVLVLLLAVISFHAAGNSISASEAQATANSFIKSQFKASPGSIKSPAMADLVLAYAEPMNKKSQANAYYIFNIKGGGFVIVAGDDNATPILGFSDKGKIDINNMPEQLNVLLNVYKADMDYLLTHKTSVSKSSNHSFREAVNVVEPMMKATWGYDAPYNLQCPIYRGKYSKVGCAGVAVAQTVFFWKFPVSWDAMPAYYAPKLSDSVPALPATVFDFEKMLPSYCHWDVENQELIQDVYTEEQAYEVAKLCRYCGQALQMNYSPVSTGPQKRRPVVLQELGFSSKAHTIYRKYYSDEQWLQLMHEELDAGKPIQYTAYNYGSDVGHVIMIDGYNSEEYFHMNFGWFGHGNGWYQMSAITPTYIDDTPRNYIGNNSFIQGLEPPLFCIINTELTLNDGLHLLGEMLTATAGNVDLNMTYRTLPFMFTLTDANGNQVAVSESITLNRLTFENHSDISLALTIPENLPEGTYSLNLNYRTADNKPLTQAVTAEGQLHVLGKLAKFGAPFNIEDVISAIDMVITETGQVDIADVLMIIDYLLEN